MEETQAIIGVLLISAIAFTGYLVINNGSAGAAVKQDYLKCCCNILASNGQQVLVRSSLQTFSTDCQTACEYNYAGQGDIFAQEDLCANNP